jgi:chorismate synthase
MRVAVGAVARRLLAEFGVSIASSVIRIGGVKSGLSLSLLSEAELVGIGPMTDASPVRCLDEGASREMVLAIDEAVKRGDTLGGVFEVIVTGLPPGLGSHIQWDTRLEGRLCQAIMGIQAIKGVEIGAGFKMAESFGSEVLDEIYYQKTEDRGQKTDSGFYRKTNHAGGVEGGMTNGMPVVVRAAMKPIPTLRKPLSSVDIITKEPFEAAYERSDACAVPAAAIVGEAMAAIVIADAFLDKFSGDSIGETRRNLESYREYLRHF